VTPQQRFDQAIESLGKATTDDERFYALDDAAKESFELGRIEDAHKYAAELLALLPKFKGNWNYGNAVQDGNLVLGRIAVRDGRIEEAKQFLIKAGESPGSPQMDSFGPNMSLAKDLLEKGQRDTVLKYFESCGRFWKMDYGKLSQWTDEVKGGEIPDFGANLIY
jgi:tetratricopeptide (TPR) repeat protein